MTAAERDKVCAGANADATETGYTCKGCGRHFSAGGINRHVYAARRRVEERSVVVR